jgi:osmotically-inducible protein OsmY
MIAKQDQLSAARHDDLELARRVENFLHSKQMRSLRSVAVEADGGRVRLRGDVGSFYEKQLCLSCTRRVAGVIDLVDEIRVAN